MANTHTQTDQQFLLAEDYADASSTESTKLAYAKDVERFRDWGGTIPCTVEQLCAYLAEHATSHKATTLGRWLASISVAHQEAGFDSPTRNIQVKNTLTGIKRVHQQSVRRVEPIVKEILIQIIDAVPEGIVGLREKAIFLVGWSGATRRSELSKLRVEDFTPATSGIYLNLGKTKTDQEGTDGRIAIPRARNQKYCPVLALQAWLKAANITTGPIFRKISKSGKVGEAALSSQAVVNIVKKMIRAVGLDPTNYAGHSLRSGFVTSAVVAGKDNYKIREITRHRTDAMLNIYIRDKNHFENNAADML
jgi:integrase